MNKDVAVFDKADDEMLEDDETWIQREFKRRSREAYSTCLLTAFEDGLEIGMKMSKREGSGKDTAVGSKEWQEEIAIHLWRKGYNLGQISLYTQLSIEHIEGLTYTIDIAKNLLDVLDVNTISLKTGLPVQLVQSLKDKSGKAT